MTSSAGAPSEWTFPAPYSARRLRLKFAMLFNSVEGPVISATAGLGIAHTGDLLIAEYVARGELQLVLDEFVTPGPPISLIYPSSGHQSAKVRVFSDFAADLMQRWERRTAALARKASPPAVVPDLG